MAEQMTQEEINQKFQEGYSDATSRYRKRPNILVCGYTGSGKSSLIRAILGDVVPLEAIGNGKPKTMGYDHYENEDVSIWDSRGLELGETEDEFLAKTSSFLSDHRRDLNPDNDIHLVWYVIQGSGARITECDLRLIKNIFPTQNVIVVITKSDVARPKQKEALKQVLLDNGVSERKIMFTSDEEGGSLGCHELMQLSFEMLPQAYQDAFAYAQQVDVELRKQAVLNKKGKAKTIVITATTLATTAAASPIPVSDAVVITPIQVSMIGGLAALYGLKGPEITVAAMPMISRALGTMLAGNLIKFIPIIGSITGTVINGTIAATLTGAMGWFVQNQFEKIAIAKVLGQPPPALNFDFEKFKDFLEVYKKSNQKG